MFICRKNLGNNRSKAHRSSWL